MMEFKNILEEHLRTMGLDITPEQIRHIDGFRRELLKWNEKVNLTRITSPEDFALKHVADSLIITKYSEFPLGARVIDIGSGPGIPGLLLKIYRRDLRVTLLESVRKKTDFLRYIVQELDLEAVQIIADRAENTAHDPHHREEYDVAVARAVSSLRVLSELCLPFVKIGGTFVAMKSLEAQQEIQEAHRAIRLLGGKLEAERDYTLGNQMGRKLVILRKEEDTPAKYPRKPGMPAKNPL